MQIHEPSSELTFLSFNQTNNCLVAGTKHGYSLWRTNPFEHCASGFNDHKIFIVEMFYSTSLIAIVCDSVDRDHDRKILYLFNTKIEQVICLLRFSEDIQAVRFNQQYLIVMLKTNIVIYTLEKIEAVCTLDIYFNRRGGIPTDVPANQTGRIALCPQRTLLAYPCDTTTGNIYLVTLRDVKSTEVVEGGDNYGSYKIIEAHDHPVAALAFTNDGSWLATASTRGTTIRIWDTHSRQQIMELKRSKIGKTAAVHSLSFSEDGSMLVVSSTSKTIHIFAVMGERKSEKSIACIYLDDEGITETYHISAFNADSNVIQVAFADGNYLHYRLPPPGASSRKCERCLEHSLLDRR
ncbi:putative WD repeat domain phosphoinositide-interacting protein 2 [Blattamonas nauphoetae]|uniref:WD repeat domain phosphoinositide-interacting protein 2 n=1 Tax=Blattamonas nauphoetae TaxID=2049346 RepID=A0ABQ9XMS1_9EUKA|nr:putative WD repeat domain phosphoinositide-interacting protein 2 [Blattamonas nauphoetae]